MKVDIVTLFFSNNWIVNVEVEVKFDQIGHLERQNLDFSSSYLLFLPSAILFFAISTTYPLLLANLLNCLTITVKYLT